MSVTLGRQLADLCRRRRTDLDITQDELAAAIRVSRGYIASIEMGRANATLDVASRLGAALGVDLALVAEPPRVSHIAQRDLVHVRCSAAVHRHLSAAGFECRREVMFTSARGAGWIDLLAFDRATRRLLIVEIKTVLDDVGAVERQAAWYEQHARAAARAMGWRVGGVRLWLLVLATEEVERAILVNRAALRLAFPSRAREMRLDLERAKAAPSDGPEAASRGLALIDPRSRRSSWLIPSRVDGRRSKAPYRDYADVARRLSGSST